MISQNLSILSVVNCVCELLRKVIVEMLQISGDFIKKVI